MNVLHIMDFAPPYAGNFIASIRCLEKHLNNSGGKVVYLFTEIARQQNWCADLLKENKTVYFIDVSFFSKRIKYQNIRRLVDIIKEEQIDILHTNFVAYNYTLFVIKFFFLSRIKIVGQFQNHFIVPENRYKKIKIFFTKATFDRIIGVSESVVESIIDAGINPDKITCITNSLATERLGKYDNYCLSDDNQNVILMFGWPFKRKGVDIAIEAIRQLNSAGSDLILAISLSGGQSIFENEIKKQLEVVPQWIKLLKPREDIATYYNAADIFLSSGREEGLAFAALEAAYCNCLLIVSAIGGNPQDIPYTEKYDVENVEQLKGAIKKILNLSKTEVDKIRILQKDYVTKTYDLDNWAESIINNYRNCC